MDTIVVGVDESTGAAGALRWAVEEAALHGAAVTAVLCWGYLDQHRGPGQPHDFDPAYTEAAAEQALEDIVDDAVGADAAASIERRTVNDLPAQGLLGLARDADLLVVGARGLNRFKEILLGSVSQHCLAHAEVPVAVIRSAESSVRGGRQRVVVGVDGSDTSRQALLWALEEGRRRQAIVEAVHAWNAPFTGGPDVPTSDRVTIAVEQAAGELLASLVDSVDTTGLPEPIVQTTACGGGGAVLVERAEGADLAVVGSRGLGGFKGLLLGSVGHQVAHHAPCPVIVIPHVR